MSDVSLTLVLQFKTSKIINDMAKVQIKSEKVTTFGGIFHVRELFSHYLGPVIDKVLSPPIELARKDNLNALELQNSNSMGYTLKTLAVALWAYWHASSFEEGLLSVVNAGGDADTNAAVACAILGAKYGFQEIPKEYVRDLAHKKRLENATESLLTLQGVSYLKKRGIKDKLFFWLDRKR